MSNSSSSSSGGIGVCGLLLVIFICAKIFEFGIVADWSWWWVFSPAWIPIAIVAAFFACIGLFALLCGAFSWVLDRWVT